MSSPADTIKFGDLRAVPTWMLRFELVYRNAERERHLEILRNARRGRALTEAERGIQTLRDARRGLTA